jgi:murein DD-endopeptidase MepM/ murein hydrolase activator NlpD
MSHTRFSLFAILLALTLAICAGAAIEVKAQGFAADSSIKSIKVTTRTEKEMTRFFVENFEMSEVTVTFEMALKNLKANTVFPCTKTIPANSKIELFEVSPADEEKPWEYSYTNFYKLGSNVAAHDDSFVYALPYAPGSTFKVTQGYDGGFSHKGSNKYAVDWKMPVGTPVYATRGGIVVKVKDDSDRGGSDIKYDSFNNYILIRHEDGTLGHYCHLQKSGVKVRVGQEVRTGDCIAKSGNTGFSSGPHLHFSVYKTKNGKQRESIPVKFATGDAPSGIVLKEGQKYRAQDRRMAEAPVINRVRGSVAGQ